MTCYILYEPQSCNLQPKWSGYHYLLIFNCLKSHPLDVSNMNHLPEGFGRGLTKFTFDFTLLMYIAPLFNTSFIILYLE